MVMVLEPTVVREIERIGWERAPAEACGILLPYPWRGQQVWEMPNRSNTPHDEFIMKGEDIALTLEDWLEETPEGLWTQIVAWHTHPSGNLGPSKADLERRPKKNLRCLVVTLYPDKEAKATWF